MGDLNDELVALEGQQEGVITAISHLTNIKAKNPELAEDLDNLISKLTNKQKRLAQLINNICDELTEIAEVEAAIYTDRELVCDDY